MNFPSGDQSNPDLPPGVDVSGVGHPPSDETNTICPSQESANHFPSGDRLGACNASTLARSSSVSLAGSIAEILAEYAAAINATSAITMIALLFILPSCGNGRANWQFARFSRKTALKEPRQTASLPYTCAAIFVLSGRRNATCGTPQKKCTAGCLTCGGLINEAFSCHQAAWLRSLRRLRQPTVHRPPRFSFFQGVATRREGSSENSRRLVIILEPWTANSKPFFTATRFRTSTEPRSAGLRPPDSGKRSF